MFAPFSKTAIKALCSVGESFEQSMNASDTALHLVKSRIGIHMLVADIQPSRVAAAVRWFVMLSLVLAMQIDACPFCSSADTSSYCIVGQKYYRWLSITHIPCISVVQSNNVEYISRPRCSFSVLIIYSIHLPYTVLRIVHIRRRSVRSGYRVVRAENGRNIRTDLSLSPLFLRAAPFSLGPVCDYCL